MKVYIVSNETNGFSDYINWIDNAEETKDFNEADLVLFAGGADVSPMLYGEKTHFTTHADFSRDYKESAIFENARGLNKPILGICRGSQFMCVMAGGKLVQDQPNPRYLHPIFTSDGKKLLISSTHHQAQFPFELHKDEYKLLAWNKDQLNYHENGKGKEMYPEKEVEIAYYPKINALAIQGHPEKLVNDRDFNKYWDNDNFFSDEVANTLSYCNELVSKLLNKQL